MTSPTSPRGMPLPLLRWRGFTLQMFLTIVVPLVIVLVIIVIYSQSLHHDAMRQLVGDRDLRAVRAASTSLSHAINDRATALEALSYLTVGYADHPGLLDRLAADYSFDAGLALFDAQGKLLAHSAAAAPGLLDYRQVNGAQTTQVSAAGRVHLTQPIKSTDGHWVSLAVMPLPAGRVLVGGFSPAAIARSTLTDVAASPDSVYLLSPTGDLIYQFGPYNHPFPISQHPGVPEVLRGESGVNYTPSGSPISAALHGLLPNMDNTHDQEHVVAFAPVAPLSWGLVLEEPWEGTVPPLLNVTQLAPLLLAPILLLTLLALWFGGRQIVEPLQSLERRARALAGGNFSAIRKPVGGIDEIRNLQDELVAMAGRLESAQEALHSYIGALTDGLETERRSLARELHDDTLQEMIALNQQVQMALLRAQDPAQRQSLNDLQARVSETIASLRRSIGGLRPIYLEDLGLAAALGMLAREDGGAPTVAFALNGTERRLPPDIELAFYRIAQEALNNAVHHAQASRVQVQLDFKDDSVSLCVSDNGRGFNVPAEPGAFAHAGHYGLLGMKERADLVGASLKIDSARGAGTQVTVEKATHPG